MPTCARRWLPVLLLQLLPAAVLAAEAVATPYGPVSLPFELHQVPATPVYYVTGESGVPGTDNEGHTSNAGFVVTDRGVVVFDALGTPALGYRLLCVGGRPPQGHDAITGGDGQHHPVGRTVPVKLRLDPLGKSGVVGQAVERGWRPRLLRRGCGLDANPVDHGSDPVHAGCDLFRQLTFTRPGNMAVKCHDRILYRYSKPKRAEKRTADVKHGDGGLETGVGAGLARCFRCRSGQGTQKQPESRTGIFHFGSPATAATVPGIRQRVMRPVLMPVCCTIMRLPPEFRVFWKHY